MVRRRTVAATPAPVTRQEIMESDRVSASLRTVLTTVLLEVLPQALEPYFQELKRTVTEVRENTETLRRQARDCNVILFGVAEKTAENCYQIAQQIAEEVQIHLPPSAIKNAYRLGRSKCRPILVKFESPAQRDAFLAQGKAIYNARKISVSPDYTPKQREARKALFGRRQSERASGKWAVVAGERLFIGKKGDPEEMEFVYDGETKQLREVRRNKRSPTHVTSDTCLPRPPANPVPDDASTSTAPARQQKPPAARKRALPLQAKRRAGQRKPARPFNTAVRKFFERNSIPLASEYGSTSETESEVSREEEVISGATVPPSMDEDDPSSREQDQPLMPPAQEDERLRESIYELRNLVMDVVQEVRGVGCFK